jgi:hypothetical protein
MVSLISFILSFFQRNKIIQVRRTPPTKGLRAYLIGLTAGFILASLNIIFDLSATNLLVSAVLFLWFAITTYFAGIFLLITAILFILLKVFSPATGSFLFMLMLNSHWYLLGYLFGGVFAILYNDLVFLFLNILEKDKIKIAFAYDPTKKFNVIKSPKESEEQAFNQLLARKPELRDRRLYKYRLQNVPKKPYTIAFVANPKILKRGGSATNQNDYVTDPIIHDLDLFLRSVDRALFSFEMDEVLGRPEIWSRVRVVTIFDEDLANASGVDFGLLQEFQDNLVINNRVVENLIDPMPRMAEKFRTMLANRLDMCDVDVIFAMTASPTHDRSTAHYSDYLENGDVVTCNISTGRALNYDPDPFSHKAGEIIPTPCPSTDPACQHDHHSTHPGRVALNVIGARDKTFIHEFAHAMSSAIHGAIVDEYADLFVLIPPEPPSDPPPPPPPQNPSPPFYVNRIERTRPGGGQFIAVHKVFAKYNDTVFHSDLAHPSAEEEWLGYFPDRAHPGIGCTMDRTIGRYRFDELISNFMYDRLCAKLNR